MENEVFEEWRPVKDYEDLYAVSDMGNVKSVERTIASGTYLKSVKEKILKPSKNSNGYLFVNLSKNGVIKRHFVHRLVAEAFIPNPNPEKYDVVNHKIEGDIGKLINTVESLEWCDTAYNNAYGTARERAAKARSKTVYQYSIAGELVKEWQSATEVYRQTGWNQGRISQCCLGKQKTYKGYRWSYTRL